MKNPKFWLLAAGSFLFLSIAFAAFLLYAHEPLDPRIQKIIDIVEGTPGSESLIEHIYQHGSLVGTKAEADAKWLARPCYHESQFTLNINTTAIENAKRNEDTISEIAHEWRHVQDLKGNFTSEYPAYNTSKMQALVRDYDGVLADIPEQDIEETGYQLLIYEVRGREATAVATKNNLSAKDREEMIDDLTKAMIDKYKLTDGDKKKRLFLKGLNRSRTDQKELPPPKPLTTA